VSRTERARAAANAAGMDPETREIHVEATVRDHLANERTFLAYVRTSLALVGFGFVIARLDPRSSLSLASGIVMVVGGVVMSLFGAFRYIDERRALIDHRTRTLGPSAATAIAVAAGAFGLLAAYDLLRMGKP
jgi:putative membrane protein